MKTIELNLWIEFGGGDGDNYEDEFTLSDQEYDTIVAFIKEYKKEHGYLPSRDLNEILQEKAPDIYNRLYKEVEQCHKNSLDEFNASQEDEEDYLNLEDYYFGFYVTDSWMESLE